MATAIGNIINADWTNTSNWTGGSGAGGIPANNDEFIINAGTVDLTTNLTTGLTGMTGRIGSGYTGDIGDSSTHLDFDGTLDFDAGGNVFATGTLTTVTIHGGRQSTDMLQFKANASTDIGTLRCLGGEGTVTVGQNAVLDTVEMFGCPRLNVVLADNITSGDNITIDSGNLTTSLAVAATLEARGGVVEVKDSATIVTLNIEEGGVVRYNSSGTITTLTNHGTFDGRANANAAVTVTNATVYEGSSTLLANGLATWVNFTNDITYRGGHIEFPANTTLSVS
jgi:hypothetical protein